MTKCIEQDARRKKPTLVYSREIKISSAMCKLCTHWTELPVCMSPRDTSVLRRYNNALWSTRIYFPFFFICCCFCRRYSLVFYFPNFPELFWQKISRMDFLFSNKRKIPKTLRRRDETNTQEYFILFWFLFFSWNSFILFLFLSSMYRYEGKKLTIIKITPK